MAIHGRSDAAARGWALMRRAGILVGAALIAMGCNADSTLLALEKPRLEVWEFPTTDKPETLRKAVNYVQYDRQNLLWFGTYGVLSAFDAQKKQWSEYSNRNGLKHMDVRMLLHEQSGTLWFAPNQHGLAKLDPATGAWSYYTHNDQIPSDKVVSIFQVRDGTIWLATEDGISRFSTQNNRWESKGKSNVKILSLAHDANGIFWLGTANGLMRFDSTTSVWTTYEPRNKTINVIALDQQGALWMGIADRAWNNYHDPLGLMKINPMTMERTVYTKKDGLPSDTITAILQDRTGTMWVGTKEGVGKLDPKAERWSSFDVADGLPSNWIRSIAEDHEGRLWVGTSLGIAKFDAKLGEWSSSQQGVEGIGLQIASMVRDRDGMLWVAGAPGRLSRFDPKSGAWSMHAVPRDMKDHELNLMVQEREGAIWLRSGDNLVRFQPSAGNFVSTSMPHSKDRISLLVDVHGVTWTGTELGVQRFDPASNEIKVYSRLDGLPDNYVTATAEDGPDVLWFGTAHGGISRFDYKRNHWKTVRAAYGDVSSATVRAIFPQKDGLVWIIDDRITLLNSTTGQFQTVDIGNHLVYSVNEGDDGTLWCGTTSTDIPNGAEGRIEGLLQFNRATLQVTHHDLGIVVNDLVQDGPGVFWLRSYDDFVRMVLDKSAEAGTLLTFDIRSRQLAQSGDTLVITRPSGVSFIDFKDANSPKLTVRDSFPGGASTTVLAPGPAGAFWVGTSMSGLALRRSDKDSHLIVTSGQGLPSMSITALATIPGSGGKRVWVGTSAGPALAWTEDETLHAQAVGWLNIPTGPVDVMDALADGTAMVVYNPIAGDRFLDSNLAERRSKTKVFHIGTEGLRETLSFKDTANDKLRIYSLAHDLAGNLWAGTASGLFVARKSASSSYDPFEAVTAQGRLPPMSIRHVRIAPDQTLWMSSDEKDETPPSIIGYKPGADLVYTLTPEMGVPRGRMIDDMSFDNAGNLMVRVGTRFARGKVFVPDIAFTAPRASWPLAAVVGTLLLIAIGAAAFQRRQHYLRVSLRERPLVAWPGTLEGMRRFGVLQFRWEELGLPQVRISTVRTLASADVVGPEKLRRLAGLLGVADADMPPVKALPHGLSLLAAQLPYPPRLRNEVVCLVTVDAAAATRAEPQEVRTTLMHALEEAGQHFELPYVLLAPENLAADILPVDLGCLRLTERDLKKLLLSRHPQQTFAGFLHTRGLLTLSPYNTAGEVKDERMFFGRTALLRELLLGGSAQQILVGPRRVGKTSLLRRLQRELQARRSDIEPIYIELLKVTDAVAAAEILARALKIKVPEDVPSDTALVEVLRRYIERASHSTDAATSAPRKLLLLIDEVDGLVEADGQAGFPLMSAMRTMQAEDACVFILAGHVYLYRETLKQSTPLYNFSTVRVIGPLEPEAALELATTPMERIGVTYADSKLAQRIVDETGGYPNFVQLVCDRALQALRTDKSADLVLREEHVSAAMDEAAQSVRETFDMNVTMKEARQIVFALLERDDFTAEDAVGVVDEGLPQEKRHEVASKALQQLKLSGFVMEQQGRMRWAIPLLRRTLRGATTR